MSALDGEWLWSFIDGDDDRAAVEIYVRHKAGRWFERLGGGGDHPTVADHFTSDDIVACCLLGMDFNRGEPVDILVTKQNHFHEPLAKVPTDVDLWDASDTVIGTDSPSWQLHDELRTIPNIDWVKAGRLMARKRPRLIPIFDSVVRARVGGQADWWLPLRALLRSDERFVPRLRQIAQNVGIDDHVTPLRVLDVALWMPR